MDHTLKRSCVLRSMNSSSHLSGNGGADIVFKCVMAKTNRGHMLECVCKERRLRKVYTDNEAVSNHKWGFVLF